MSRQDGWGGRGGSSQRVEQGFCIFGCRKYGEFFLYFIIIDTIINSI